LRKGCLEKIVYSHNPYNTYVSTEKESRIMTFLEDISSILAKNINQMKKNRLIRDMKRIEKQGDFIYLSSDA